MLLSLLKTVIIFISSIIIMGVSIWYGFSGFFAPTNMEEYLKPDAASQFYDIKGNLIYTTLSEERRIPVGLEKIPKYTQQAFIAIEDNRFYEHSGVDFRGTARALISTISGREVQGGSTITQQLAKNAFLTQERTITRKIKEAFIARELEKKYTKDEILNMYLNQIYFGQGSYGVESASMYYFGKHVQDLTIAESATLASMPKSPNYYNPYENPKDTKARQELVISQMVKYGFISEAEGQAAKDEKLALVTSRNKTTHPKFYFLDMISQKVMDEVGVEALYKGGLKIYTTLDSDMQTAAEAALKHLPDIYTDKNKLHQPQVALVAIDPHNGQIKALIGGRGEDKFNRATLAVRQPGSAFKPFVYVTAMANGFTPASIIEDKEEEFSPGWKPQNSSKKFYGKVSLRTALKRSINVATIKLAQEVGVNKIVSTAEKMGISTLVDSGTYNDMNLAMAIGGLTNGVSPLEMASAYGVLATNGSFCKPHGLIKIVASDGKVLYEHHSHSKQVIDEKAAYLTTNILEDVLVSGTGGGMGIGRPAAGKTGTTDNFVDAWFVGYTPNLSTAVWVGDDNNTSIDYMYGSGYPLSIWHDFMYNAHKDIPASSFINPGVVVPPEPKIEQEDKEKKSLTDKLKNIVSGQTSKEKEEVRKQPVEEEKPVVSNQPVRRSMKERVQEILGKNK